LKKSKHIFLNIIFNKLSLTSFRDFSQMFNFAEKRFATFVAMNRQPHRLKLHRLIFLAEDRQLKGLDGGGLAF
jgi:hypothetical protein